jgi:hypothetical protein
MFCTGAVLPIEEWTHSNSLRIAPTGEILQSVRHLDTVLAISPHFDRIAWRIGRFKSEQLKYPGIEIRVVLDPTRRP